MTQLVRNRIIEIEGIEKTGDKRQAREHSSNIVGGSLCFVISIMGGLSIPIIVEGGVS